MAYQPHKPLIVQSDGTVLLEVDNPEYPQARDVLAAFAELERSPEHIHTYRITPLSLWNAAAAGWTAERILAGLERYSKYEVPPNVRREVQELIGRYGRLKLIQEAGELRLVGDDPALVARIARDRRVARHLIGPRGPLAWAVDPGARGWLKQALVKIGFPAEDLAGYVEGAPLEVALREVTRSGRPFRLRPYQQEATAAFLASGNGVVVLPCGAGKTIVGLAALAGLKTQTLILATNTVAVRQWIAEILDKTTLSEEEVGEYSGERKEVRPVTVTTYQILTYRRRKEGDYPHFALFDRQNWGLIIYDEVHLLPAPVFRMTAQLQARRRLGLTATLVREDGREEEVFSLIGPKRFDVPWLELESQGWIATAYCYEVRIKMDPDLAMEYALAEPRRQYRLAAENPAKIPIVASLVRKHAGDRILIIGQYLAQLRRIAKLLDAPLLTGNTPNREREALYRAFREGRIPVLVVSRVANFSVDLPDANVAIQVSGTFGSRQEEAQRLGRILRPKEDGRPAFFYTLVSAESVDQTYAAKRQRFLTEQGYHYEILYAEEIGAFLPSEEVPS